MLKARATALQPHPRVGAFMLFPVISDVVGSPGGKISSVRTSLLSARVTSDTLAFSLLHTAFIPPTLALFYRICFDAPKICAAMDPPPLLPFLAGEPVASRTPGSTIHRGDIRISDDGRRHNEDGPRTRR